MYIDFNKYDYSLIDESERSLYIERDKAAYREIILEWFNSKVDEIVERKWLIEDLQYLASVSDFIKLLKEAENLFELGFYTGCIALTSISVEDFTKFLATQLGVEKLVDKTQFERIKGLKKEGLIKEDIYDSLDLIRKIRNDCLHYNQYFNKKANDELKSDAIEVLNLFKKILQELIGFPSTPEVKIDNFTKVLEEAAKQFMSENNESVKNFEDMILKLRNAASILLGMPIAFHPDIKIVIYSRVYKVWEIDLDINPPEITLEDVTNSLPVFVDLQEKDKQLLEREGIKKDDIIQAKIISEVSNTGQTEAWKFLHLRKM
ncbi:hypothetical protein [Okeania sp. KiyG1]|uniref:hypothetical protein n=1 Tax=Okeania sp. KiyG1 TaxID=2720165 RepID=UPI0019220C19|nr:hypothetical protein [Okeania sp. KiyG1]GGA15085.1 hypothetical protein CYANOKiyG1_28830 [Okeania sp. KiyG1]